MRLYSSFQTWHISTLYFQRKSLSSFYFRGWLRPPMFQVVIIIYLEPHQAYRGEASSVRMCSREENLFVLTLLGPAWYWTGTTLNKINLSRTSLQFFPLGSGLAGLLRLGLLSPYLFGHCYCFIFLLCLFLLLLFGTSLNCLALFTSGFFVVQQFS